MSGLIDNMTKVLNQAGDKVIDQQGRLFSDQIKKYAQQYLAVMEAGQQTLKDFEVDLELQKNIQNYIKEANIQASYEWRTLIQNRHLMERKDFWREMVTASLKFQSQLNELLDQKVELVYVFNDRRNNPILYTIDQRTLTSVLSYQSNRGKIKGRFTQSSKFKACLNNLTRYQLYENFNLNYFNYTYKQVIWRFNYGHSKGSDLIMWLNPIYRGPDGRTTKWLKASVGQQGDIKEAYASILLDRRINSVKLFDDEKLDNNVHSFMEELAKVDDESGLLSGDVTVGQIEYAIKGVKASTLGLAQIIDVAKKILEKTSYIKEDLEQQKREFHEKANTRNKIESFAISQQTDLEKQIQKDLRIEVKNQIGMNILVRYQPSDYSWFE